MDKNMMVCYGDTVTINSDSMYLSGRSFLEKKVYFTKVLNNRIDIQMYENFNECEFIIHPKLSYESYKNY